LINSFYISRLGVDYRPMEDARKELPVPYPELSGDMPLLPARMVNE
jgi:hypothetical protein